MKKIAAAIIPVILLAACAANEVVQIPVGEGNIQSGKQAFVDLQCHQCHTVAGVALPSLAGESPVQLMLGGETSVVKSQAGLLTSIINPDHVISERYREQLRLDAEVPLDSPMPMPPIDNMTVRQLLDIVAFLDSRYALIDDYQAGG